MWMMYAMNVKRFPFLRQLFAGILVLSLIQLPCVSQAESEEPKPEIPPTTPVTPPYLLNEAAKATIGRAFGVEGPVGEIDYYVVDLSRSSRLNASLRSFFIPGWGQAFNGQKTKALLMFTAWAAATAGAVMAYRDADDSYDTYTARGIKEDPSYDDYTHARTRAMVLGGVAVAMWGISLIDAYRNAYSSLWSRAEPPVQIVADPDGTEVRFSKKF